VPEAARTMVIFPTLLTSVEGVSELMCHPGRADEKLLSGSTYARERERELAILCDREIRTLLAEVLPEQVAADLSTGDLESVRRAVATHPDLHAPARVQGEDLLAALGVFLVVVASTFPVALPFLLIHDVSLAKTVSRGLSLALLFVGGYAVGRYSGVRPVWMGLAMLGIGAVLVAAVTALGG